jgi:transposase
LADGLRQVKQRIKSLLLEFGLDEPMGLQHWSRASVAALKDLPMPPGVDLTLGSLIRELDFIEKEMAQVRKELKMAVESERGQASVKFMLTVPGVGWVTASTFCLELYRPERFNNASEVASYLGLAPMTRHSGQGKPRARLRPVGQKRLRSLLIEAAWAWKRRDAQAQSMYRRLVARHGLPQKAIAALARKLATILWRLCLEHRPYRPEPVTG